MGTNGSFLESKLARGVKLTSHLHEVPRLRMHRATPLHPHTPSFHGIRKLYLLPRFLSSRTLPPCTVPHIRLAAPSVPLSYSPRSRVPIAPPYRLFLFFLKILARVLQILRS